MEFNQEINLEIKNFEVDFNGELKLNSLFNFFQFIASQHADMLNFGYKDLEEANLIWILTGIKVDFNDIPKWNDIVTLRTITKGITGIYAIRNFEIINEENKIIVTAMSSWILIDRTSFRPIRIQRHPTINPVIFFENPQISPLEKISLSQNKIIDFEYRFVYSDIDINQHVNNAKYVELISDRFNVYFYKLHKIKHFQINFVHQAIFDEIVEVRIEQTDNLYFKIEGVNKDTQKQIFVSEIIWNLR